jgi:hypothetical protein
MHGTMDVKCIEIPVLVGINIGPSSYLLYGAAALYINIWRQKPANQKLKKKCSSM